MYHDIVSTIKKCKKWNMPIKTYNFKVQFINFSIIVFRLERVGRFKKTSFTLLYFCTKNNRTTNSSAITTTGWKTKILQEIKQSDFVLQVNVKKELVFSWAFCTDDKSERIYLLGVLCSFHALVSYYEWNEIIL